MISSLTHTFTVSSVNKTFTTSTFTNVIKRRESILYRDSVPMSAANIAYVTSEEIAPSRNLSIADRSVSLEANRITNKIIRTESSIDQFTISTENFVVTDIFTDVTGTIAAIPLFYVHILDTSQLPRGTGDILGAGVNLLEVKILDSTFSILGLEEFKINYNNGYVYSNLLSKYIASDDYTLYYVQYTVDNNGSIQTYVDLLDNSPVFHLATLDDLTASMLLDPTSNAYLIEEISNAFEITLPRISTYAYKSTVDARIQLLQPVVEDTDNPWYIRVSNGKFFTNLDGSLHKYYIAEFLSQSFFPAIPQKTITSERSTVVNNTIIKLDRDNVVINADESIFLNIFINDVNDIGLYALTTNTSLVGTIASNGVLWSMWSEAIPIGIRSIDKRSGFIDLEGIELKNNNIVRSSYVFTETQYELSLLNFNPVMNQSIVQQRASIFLDPEVGIYSKTQTLYYLLSDKSGKVVQSNWDRFNNTTQLLDDGKQVYYESFPSFLQTTNPSGLDYLDPTTHKFISDFTVEVTGNTDNFLVLGDVTVGEATSVAQLTTIDTRIQGGGIREDSWDQAVIKDPHVQWFWDKGSWDGAPYPGAASYCVEVPVALLEGAGGNFTAAGITDVINKHTALGVYPVIKGAGVDITLSGLIPQSDGITFNWTSRGYPEKVIYYNIYHSTSENGPWTTATASPILHVVSGHNYTVTGLRLGVEYYLAVIGGALDSETGEFLPLPSQSLSDQVAGVASIGTGVEPQTKFRTYAPHTIIDSTVLTHTFTVV